MDAFRDHRVCVGLLMFEKAKPRLWEKIPAYYCGSCVGFSEESFDHRAHNACFFYLWAEAPELSGSLRFAQGQDGSLLAADEGFRPKSLSNFKCIFSVIVGSGFRGEMPSRDWRFASSAWVCIGSRMLLVMVEHESKYHHGHPSF